MLASRRDFETLCRAVCELKESSERLAITQGIRRFVMALSALKESSELLELRSNVRLSAGTVDELEGQLWSGTQFSVDIKDLSASLCGSNPRTVFQTAKMAMPLKKIEGLVRVRGGDQ